ncbi:DUF4365 domain-containing protein [Pseudomonas sp. PDM15]|uniref:DUF4365 domain-containing protein n=1 Tax=Pseudomonas sp. PDM15 TaxID=2769303 RepID=UPI0017837F48|nr:DUF4365 domain-containing protein [Pseudomonas sp. PDM15]MBD9424638.1 DUF4365 domain-containing protein [Pseudomonas sp. PDM15]
MNYPLTQRTGVLSEMAVAQLFVSWSWNVGRDQVDIGYDLFVAPSHDVYKGGRFLVQVKGTAKSTKKGAIRASVSKSRLRQYAESIVPVFLVRVTSDSEVYWLHAQAWACMNESRLLGKGYVSVDFDRGQCLNNRVQFEKYLKPILCSVDQRAQIQPPEILHSFSGVAAQENESLNSESDFPESLLAELSFTPVRDVENINKLKDVFYFGLPGKFAVEQFNISGLPIPDGYSGGFGQGELTVDPVNFTAGKICLIPGGKRAVTSAELVIDAELFSGWKGFAVTNERKPSVLDVCIRFLVGENFSSTPSAKISFRTLLMSQGPIRGADYLSNLHLWAEQALNRQGFSIEMEFSGQRIFLPLPREFQEPVVEFLHLAHVLGKIHLIARATDSAISVPAEFSLSREELNNINTAFSLLRGDKQQAANSLTMRLEPHKKMLPAEKVSLSGVKTLVFTLFEQELCKIPVQFDLVDFRVESIPGSADMLITPGAHGQAWLSFAEDYSEEMEGAWFSTESSA